MTLYEAFNKETDETKKLLIAILATVKRAYAMNGYNYDELTEEQKMHSMDIAVEKFIQMSMKEGD